MSRTPISAFEATVLAIEDLSPSFRRFTLGGPGMADFGVAVHPRDLRIKLIIPADGGPAPTFDLLDFFTTTRNDPEPAALSWYQAWLHVDPSIRGCMRTYTVRQWRDAERELVVDMVLHTDTEGHSGPASAWAESAGVGHRLHILGPSREAEGSYSGIEFDRGQADRVLLAGDETAVPAIASILDSLQGSTARGLAFLEVPTAADIHDIPTPDGVEIHWLPRGEAAYGVALESAVRESVRTESPLLPRVGVTAPAVQLDDIDIDSEILWDVPSALTEAARSSSSGVDKEARPFYAWIAGEAGPVKRLRRYLVQEVGVDRQQIAFMGYWRQGRAES